MVSAAKSHSESQLLFTGPSSLLLEFICPAIAMLVRTMLWPMVVLLVVVAEMMTITTNTRNL